MACDKRDCDWNCTTECASRKATLEQCFENQGKSHQKDQAEASSLSDLLCTDTLKSYLGATRCSVADQPFSFDPFLRYQEARMTKGALLQIIAGEVKAYLKTCA